MGSDDPELQLVVFKLGDKEFGVDISQVREIIRVPVITRIPNAPDFVEGVINLRGKITPVMDLRGRLGMRASRVNEHTRIVIVEIGMNSMGMIVDSASEVRRLSAKDIDFTSVGTAKIGDKFIQGVGKFEDGLLILLDLEGVFSWDDGKERKGGIIKYLKYQLKWREGYET